MSAIACYRLDRLLSGVQLLKALIFERENKSKHHH